MTARGVNRENLNRREGQQIVNLYTNINLLGLKKVFRRSASVNFISEDHKRGPLYTNIKDRGVYKVKTMSVRRGGKQIQFLGYMASPSFDVKRHFLDIKS